MDFAIQIFQIVFYSVAILFMLTFMFIGIWSFIIFNKIRKGFVVQNYILEKIYKVISHKSNTTKESSIDMAEFLEDEVFSPTEKADNIIQLDEA